MEFRFRPMTAADARAVERWRYPAPYDVYDRRSGRSLDPASDPGRYFAAENREGLAGFFEFERAEEGCLHFDLSLRPELTGEGHGESFVRAGLQFADEQWSPEAFEVTVDSFNDRALTVYDRLGFDQVGERAVSDGGEPSEARRASSDSSDGGAPDGGTAEHVTMRREEPLD